MRGARTHRTRARYDAVTPWAEWLQPEVMSELTTATEGRHVELLRPRALLDAPWAVRLTLQAAQVALGPSELPPCKADGVVLVSALAGGELLPFALETPELQ